MQIALLRTLLVATLVAVAGALSVNLIALANSVKQRQSDLAELNDIKYGLLDADVWVGQVSAIVSRRIDEFELTPENRPVFKARIEAVLDRLLSEVESHMGTQQEQKSDVGRALSRLANRIREILIPFDQLRAGVPDYAEAILEELSRPDAKAEIKLLVTAGIKAAADSTFSRTDRSRLDQIVSRYACGNLTACRAQLQYQSAADLEQVRLLMLGIVAVALLAFLVAMVRNPGLSAGLMLGLTGTLAVLLIGGVTTPMIGIEAKISRLTLEVLGEQVEFRNQVLYFQSKSVVDVVILLARTGAPDMILVAGLVGLFSIVFPLAKVLCGFAWYYHLRGARNSKVLSFFALYSGKWSMADVMVVAIFMSYIGFRGLVSSQLDDLANTTDPLEILTTNGTTLHAGFFLFLTFCLGSLVLSTLLENRAPKREPVTPRWTGNAPIGGPRRDQAGEGFGLSSSLPEPAIGPELNAHNTAKASRPSTEEIINAIDTPKFSAIQPILKNPIGPLPMHNVSTPRTRLRYSGVAAK